MPIIVPDKIDDLKVIESKLKGTHFGLFYALEYGDFIKIGCTKLPYTRYRSLKRTAEVYGNCQLGSIYISQPHTNYSENESKLHLFFEKRQMNDSELFSIGIQEFVSSLDAANLAFEDNSREIEDEGRAFLNVVRESISASNTRITPSASPQELADLIEITRETMLEAGYSPRDILIQTKYILDAWHVPTTFLDPLLEGRL